MTTTLQKIYAKIFDNGTKKINAKSVRESFALIDEKIGNISSGFQGSINPTTPTPIEGWQKGFYSAEISGTYNNAGGIVVNLNDGYTGLVFDGENWTSFVLPVNIMPTNTLDVDNLEKAISSKAVLDYVGYNYITNYNFIDGLKNWASDGGGSVVSIDNGRLKILANGNFRSGVIGNFIFKKGKINISFDLDINLIRGDSLLVQFSNGQSKFLKVKNGQQTIIFDFELNSDCNWWAIQPDSLADYYIHNIFVINADNNSLFKQTIGNSDKIKNINKKVFNNLLSDSFDFWRTDGNSTLSKENELLKITVNNGVSEGGAIYDVVLLPGEYVFDLDFYVNFIPNDKNILRVSFSNGFFKDFVFENKQGYQNFQSIINLDNQAEWICVQVLQGGAIFMVGNVLISNTRDTSVKKDIIVLRRDFNILNNLTGGNILNNNSIEVYNGWTSDGGGSLVSYDSSNKLLNIKSNNNSGVLKNIAIPKGIYLFNISLRNVIIPSQTFRLTLSNGQLYTFKVINSDQIISDNIQITSDLTWLSLNAIDGGEFSFDAVKLISIDKESILSSIELNPKGVKNELSSRVKFPSKLVRLDFFSPNTDLPETKGVKLNGTFIYNDGEGTKITKYATLEVQGSTSSLYPKKNWTFGLYNDIGNKSDFKLKIGDWAYHSEFVWKANWIDATQSRNIMANRIWEDIIQSRVFPKREFEQIYFPNNGFLTDRFDTGALGHVDGFPAEVYINGIYYGLGTFNLGKKRENYNIVKSNKNHIQLGAETHADFLNWKVEEWELRNPSKISDAQAKIDRLFAFNKLSTTNPASFKSNFYKYYNLVNVIDYYLFINFLFATDCISKNLLLTTWNGDLWNFMPYDLDTTFGITWAGGAYEDYVSRGNIMLTPFWDAFFNAFQDKIKLRYAVLRVAILTESNIYSHFSKFARVIGKEAYERDFAKWTLIPSNNQGLPALPDGGTGVFTSLSQIMKYTRERLSVLDSIYQ